MSRKVVPRLRYARTANRRRRTEVAGSLLAPIVLCAGLAVPAATAEPTASAPTAADGAHLSDTAAGAGRLHELRVFSAAMNTEIALDVLPAADRSAPAPVLYLLNGAAGGTDGSNWPDRTDVVDFFADKQVTVVVPQGGRASYFTDWQADDPELGRQQWETFLTQELPPVIDGRFRGTGANAIAGISMAGTSVFQLALAAPGLYRAVGSYSGCASTSDPLGQAVVAGVVAHWGGNPLHMWGPPSDPMWVAKDPYVQAERLRGTAIYVSTGNGAAGPLDTLDGPGVDGDIGTLASQLGTGGVIEAATNLCAHRLRDRLQQLAIPATFELRPHGTHSWGYWQQDLHRSWPLFAAALNG